MSNTISDTGNLANLEILKGALEDRLGQSIAQEFIENINLTLNEGKTPDYMVVKACSVALELFRGEAQEIVKELKRQRLKWEESPNITAIELHRLEADFRHIYRVWWISMKLFYPLYNEALSAARRQKFPVQRDHHTSNERAMAA